MAKTTKPQTKSQRLRWTIEKIWAKGKKEKPFEQYYSDVMDIIINHYEEKYLKAPRSH